ncbi:deubiquitinase MYSM1-like isoform X2 [Mya arenaria]|uniref:deubiquitinase MYSM1-like isoform X2 n=1 Tax=Mya arenaria TaxID=6604 RepID=UPI0022E07200|nr:deubiquitinase MYSM1-like isoform X2 [Mya arenaria]
MADDGEVVDVLGDFEFKLQADDGMYDANELPSQSANLLPEFTHPPWMLDQCWPMDACMDEKSKATIEKMLLEEQYYTCGKMPKRKQQQLIKEMSVNEANSSKVIEATVTPSLPEQPDMKSELQPLALPKSELLPLAVPKTELLPLAVPEANQEVVISSLESNQMYIRTSQMDTGPSQTDAGPSQMDLQTEAGSDKIDKIRGMKWTEDEKRLFIDGMEMYGKRWLKVAEMIPTKTYRQTKSFAYQQIKAMEKKGLIENPASHSIDSIDTNYELDPLQEMLYSVATGNTTIRTCTRQKINEVHDKRCIPKQRNKSYKKKHGKPNTSSKYFPTDNIGISGELQNVTDTLRSDHSNSSDPVNTLRLDHSNSSDPVVNTEFIDGIGSGVQVWISSSVEDKAENDEEDTVINIEDDEEEEEVNPLLAGRSVSPTSIYESLLSSANIKSHPRTKCGGHYTWEPVIDVEREDSTCLDFIDQSSEYKPQYEDNFDRQDIKSHVKVEIPDTPDIQNQSDETVQVNSLATTAMHEVALKQEQNWVKFENQLATVMDETAEQYTDIGSDSESQQKEISDGEISKPVPTVERVKVNVVILKNGEVVHFPFPTEETKIACNMEVTEEERNVMSEFFDACSKGSKNPNRYIRIRNTVLESWQKCKPDYLTKTRLRHYLKSCGDVNAIGRVHAFLEAKGAINYGCDQCMYKTPRSLPIPNSGIRGKNKTSSTYDVEKRESGRTRKRKDPYVVWDSVEKRPLKLPFEGKTFQHGDDGSAPLELFKLSDPQYLSILVSEARKEKKQPSPNADRRRQMRKPVVTLFKDQYDPFKLIPCLPFSSDKPPPFKVEIHCSSLMIMDMHSHISKTEVIGMLGGRYCPGRGKLTVVQAIPCKSVSTGMQCEMDPVSQTLASEDISRSGLEVVGWYHSHPSFAPNPSVRDIETQTKFQQTKSGCYQASTLTHFIR